MSFLTLYLNQTATYWKRQGADGFGNIVFSSPVQIRCRWEDRTQFIQNAQGDNVPSRSTVFLEQDVSLDDFLFLGKTSEPNPTNLDFAYKVMDFRRTPSLDGKDFERRALL